MVRSVRPQTVTRFPHYASAGNRIFRMLGQGPPGCRPRSNEDGAVYDGDGQRKGAAVTAQAMRSTSTARRRLDPTRLNSAMSGVTGVTGAAAVSWASGVVVCRGARDVIGPQTFSLPFRCNTV